jgi:LysM repeat protein
MRIPIKFIILFICLVFTLVSVPRVTAQSIRLQVAPTDNPPSALPLVTSTPAEDGTVVHIVEYGQTLITIAQAYGISVTELKDLNGLQSDTVFAGDKLIIRRGATPTATLTPTRTIAPTRTSTATRIPPTATPLPTITPTPTQTPNPFQAWLSKNTLSSRQTLGIGIVAACLIGLVVVGLTGFRKA